MFEKATTSFIISGSSLLLAYWFRYVCLLVLTAKPPRDYGELAASANQLSFPAVRGMLRRASAADLDGLGRMLDRDYQVLSYLLKNIAQRPAGMAAIETRMLAIDYQLMRWWFRSTSRSSPRTALRALTEMSNIVAHFANAMGERMGNAVAH